MQRATLRQDGFAHSVRRSRRTHRTGRNAASAQRWQCAVEWPTQPRCCGVGTLCEMLCCILHVGRSLESLLSRYRGTRSTAVLTVPKYFGTASTGVLAVLQCSTHRSTSVRRALQYRTVRAGLLKAAQCCTARITSEHPPLRCCHIMARHVTPLRSPNGVSCRRDCMCPLRRSG